MEWIRADTNLIFEKKKHSFLRVINFISKTLIIIIPEINYFKLVLKMHLNGIRTFGVFYVIHYTIFSIGKCVMHSLLQLQPAEPRNYIDIIKISDIIQI